MTNNHLMVIVKAKRLIWPLPETEMLQKPLVASILLAFLACLFANVAAFAEEVTDLSCQDRFEAWLQEKGQDRPSTYDELMQLSQADRRAVFVVLSPEVRSSIWQTHFERYLALHGSELEPAQLALVKSATELASERFFRTPASDPAYGFLVRKPLEKLTAKAYEILSEQQITDLFYQLGSAESASAPPQKLVPFCHCANALDCDSGFCVNTGLCYPIKAGCGNFWIEPCSGLCSG